MFVRPTLPLWHVSRVWQPSSLEKHTTLRLDETNWPPWLFPFAPKLTPNWKEAQAGNKVKLKPPPEPPTPHKKNKFASHKSWWPLKREGENVSMCCVWQFCLWKAVPTRPTWRPSSPPQPWTAGPPQGAAIWIVDGPGQEIGLGVSPPRTVCILKKATLNAWPPHCPPWQSHLTIFCTLRPCGGGLVRRLGVTRPDLPLMYVRPRRKSG